MAIFASGEAPLLLALSPKQPGGARERSWNDVHNRQPTALASFLGALFSPEIKLVRGQSQQSGMELGLCRNCGLRRTNNLDC